MRGVNRVPGAELDVNSLAVVVAVMIIGAAAYAWRKGQLRSPAAFVTLGLIVAILLFVAFYSPGPVG